MESKKTLVDTMSPVISLAIGFEVHAMFVSVEEAANC